MSTKLNPSNYRGGIALASIGAGRKLQTMRIARPGPDPDVMQNVEDHRAAIKATGEMPLFVCGAALVQAVAARDVGAIHQNGNVLMNELAADYLGLIERDGQIVGCAPVRSMPDQATFETWANKEFVKLVDEVVRSLNAGEATVNVANMEAALGFKAHPTQAIKQLLPSLGGE